MFLKKNLSSFVRPRDMNGDSSVVFDVEHMLRLIAIRCMLDGADCEQVAKFSVTFDFEDDDDREEVMTRDDPSSYASLRMTFSSEEGDLVTVLLHQRNMDLRGLANYAGCRTFDESDRDEVIDMISRLLPSGADLAGYGLLPSADIPGGIDLPSSLSDEGIRQVSQFMNRASRSDRIFAVAFNGNQFPSFEFVDAGRNASLSLSSECLTENFMGNAAITSHPALTAFQLETAFVRNACDIMGL